MQLAAEVFIIHSGVVSLMYTDVDSTKLVMMTHQGEEPLTAVKSISPGSIKNKLIFYGSLQQSKRGSLW